METAQFRSSLSRASLLSGGLYSALSASVMRTTGRRKALSRAAALRWPCKKGKITAAHSAKNARSQPALERGPTQDQCRESCSVHVQAVCRAHLLAVVVVHCIHDVLILRRCDTPCAAADQVPCCEWCDREALCSPCKHTHLPPIRSVKCLYPLLSVGSRKVLPGEKEQMLGRLTRLVIQQHLSHAPLGV